MSRTDLDPATLAKAIRRMAGGGIVEWVYEPIQASVLHDVADMLDENANLRQQLADVTESMGRVEERCAKLRELCADMGMCLTWQWEPHGYMMDGCDHCRFKKKTGGMCGLGMFRGRMRELGVEVD